MSGELEQQRAASSICGVVVTYRPAASVVDNLRAMLRECGRLIVVDNGSPESARVLITQVDGVEVIALGENQGIATALNKGMARAAASGAEWVVTFDQDSLPQPGFVPELLATAQRIPGVALVGPFIQEEAVGEKVRWVMPHPRCPLFFSRVPCLGEDLPDVTMVITSGALTSVEAWRRAGGFEDKLFIDFVDTDFCLRLRSAGWRVAVSSRARLVHHLGKREAREMMGKVFFPTHHEPIRHYYIARNRVLMVGRHGWRHPHWLMFECAAVLMWIFRVLVFEHRRGRKIKAMLLGTWAGLRGRFGACPRPVMERLQS